LKEKDLSYKLFVRQNACKKTKSKHEQGINKAYRWDKTKGSEERREMEVGSSDTVAKTKSSKITRWQNNKKRFLLEQALQGKGG
jgi:hypothetical protein